MEQPDSEHSGQGIPHWFTEAIATARDHSTVDADGVTISYRAWGKPGDPLVVLVHGGAAHGGWWDHIAPFMTDQHRVVAIDLAGHGDSGWREEYSLESWAGDVRAVIAAETSEPAVLFGHSMGGFVALTAARLFGSELRAVAAIDSPVREMSAEAKAWLDSNPAIPDMKVYGDAETIIARFKTLPTDESNLPYINRHIAESSIKAVDGADKDGWTWKFDPRIFLSTRMQPEMLAEADCDVALVRGERGMATRDITDNIRERLGGRVPVVLIPDAGHHIMLDQPIAMIAVFNTLLSQWRNS